jgi:outer membrane protein assembly factor BamB
LAAEDKTAGMALPATDAPDAAACRPRRHLRRALIAGVIAAAIIATLQWIAPATDHQHANMVSVVVGLIALLFVLCQLHLHARWQGHRRFVPASAFTAMAVLVTLFRFDGFSGEMLPQFKWRFADSPLELRSVVNRSGSAAADQAADPAAVASFDSLGFLGSDRTAVIGERRFSIPREVSQIRTLWNQGIGEGWSSFAVSDAVAVTLEQREQLECVTCYRLADGELLWIRRHEARHENPLGGIGPRSTPTIVDGRVYAQGATGRLWCLDLHTGQEFWSVDLLELASWDQAASETAISWGRAGSPLVIDGLCVVPYGGPETNAQTGRSLIAFDADTGKTRWVSGQHQISFASAALLTLGGRRQIVIVNQGTITAHEPQSGEVLWEFPWPGQSNADANCTMVVPAGPDRFLVGKGYGGGSALVEVTGGADGSMVAEAVWRSTQVLKTKFTHACIDGDVAYAISNGSLEAVRLHDAEPLWVQPRKMRFGQGQLLLVGDTLVAQSESGELVLVAADRSEYRELWRMAALNSKTWNIPTVAGRHVLVRNDRQAICYLLPE